MTRNHDSDIPIAEFESAASELECAHHVQDFQKAQDLLRKLWQLDFHGHRNGSPSSWDRLFGILADLVGAENDEVSHLARHYLFVILGNELGPPYEEGGEEKRRLNLERRVGQALPSFQVVVSKKPRVLLDLVDELVHVEKLCDTGPLPDVVEWFESMKKNGMVGENLLKMVEIAYIFSRMPWDQSLPRLFPLLDHGDSLVRAYAARTIGRFYHEDESHSLRPSLKEILTTITDKEIERPGIAGPLLSDYYSDMDLERFQEEAGVAVEAWFCDILSRRKGPEPDMLPCSNGIDFFAHEIFGGHAGYIRKLLDMNHRELALEAATEVDERIDGLESPLIELGNDEDSETCRRASWHLAYHYRYLHPKGEKRGFVKRLSSHPDVDLFLNFSLEEGRFRPYSAVLYPARNDFFNDQEAWEHADRILPPEVRGRPVPHPGSVQRRPEALILGKNANYAYGNRAFICFKGDVEKKRWLQIRVIWQGGGHLWKPL